MSRLVKRVKVSVPKDVFGHLHAQKATGSKKSFRSRNSKHAGSNAKVKDHFIIGNRGSRNVTET